MTHSYDREEFLNRFENSLEANEIKRLETKKNELMKSLSIIPFRLKLYILEFYQLGIWGNDIARKIIFKDFGGYAYGYLEAYKNNKYDPKIYHGLIKVLFGYFKDDRFRKSFLIFRSVETNIFLNLMPLQIKNFNYPRYAQYSMVLKTMPPFHDLQKLNAYSIHVSPECPNFPESIREIQMNSTDGRSPFATDQIFPKFPQKLKKLQIIGHNLQLRKERNHFKNLRHLEQINLYTYFRDEQLIHQLPISMKSITLSSCFNHRLSFSFSTFSHLKNLKYLLVKDVTVTGRTNEFPEFLESLTLSWISFDPTVKLVFNKNLKKLVVFMGDFGNNDESKKFCFENVEEMDEIELLSGQFSQFPKKRVKKLGIQYWAIIREESEFPEEIDRLVVGDCKDFEPIANSIKKRVKKIDVLDFSNRESQIRVETAGWNHLKDIRVVRCVRLYSGLEHYQDYPNKVYFTRMSENLPMNIQSLKIRVLMNKKLLENLGKLKNVEEIYYVHEIAFVEVLTEEDFLEWLMNFPKLRKFTVLQNAHCKHFKRTPFNFEVFRNNDLLKERNVVLDLESYYHVFVK